MADEGDILTDLNMDAGNAGPANGVDNQPAIGLVTQYIKDLSVENPNAPDCFQWQLQPEIDLQFNIGSAKIEEDLHEVELKVNVTAKTEKGNLYLIELSYCGLFGMRNVPDDQAHAFVFAEAPRLLFPFARRVVADAVRDAGFPPLMLDPIDFQGLYAQQLQQRREQGIEPSEVYGKPTN